MRRRAYLAMAATGAVAGCLGEPRQDYRARPLPHELRHAGEHTAPAPGLTWFGDLTRALEAIDTKRWADDDARDAARAFIEESDPDSVEVLELASGGPSRGHDRIEVEYLATTEDEIVGAAHVVDDGDTAAEPAYPTAFVRFEADEELPTTARIEITDGWDETTEYVAHGGLQMPGIGLPQP